MLLLQYPLNLFLLDKLSNFAHPYPIRIVLRAVPLHVLVLTGPGTVQLNPSQPPVGRVTDDLIHRDQLKPSHTAQFPSKNAAQGVEAAVAAHP